MLELHHELNLRLAVSGGVDSMALATMYSSARRKHRSLPECHGIIVDHKSRPGSSEEAEWVKEQLLSRLSITRFELRDWLTAVLVFQAVFQRVGIHSTIVPLTWPEVLDVNGVGNPRNENDVAPNFESQARKLRFQALGGLCRDKGIKNLMLAHHRDDQAETVLSRLINWNWRAGLQAIVPVNDIPECDGMHGIHQSGSIMHTLTSLPMLLEKGGVRVLRPLLGFDKDQLIATCKKYNVPWTEDETNQDPTLTERNAIRHVLRHHKLPAAICKDSLISLSKRMQERITSHKDHAEDLFNRCPLQVNLQTGSLSVRLPPVQSLLDRPIVSESDKHYARNTACILLKRIATLVSPDTPELSRFDIVTETFYPTLTPSTVGVGNDWSRNCVTLTTGKVAFTATRISHPSVSLEASADETGCDLFLRRQPVSRRDVEKLYITIPPSDHDPTAGNTWHLWDGRYWIRVQNHGKEPLIIRLFQPGDHDRLVKDDRHLVRAMLRITQNPQFGHQFPGIYRMDEDGRETLLALPSFNLTLEPIHKTKDTPMNFDIRYKQVDLGVRAPEEVIVKGITRSHNNKETSRLLAEQKRQNKRGKTK
ncbi:adenine nucleotide alpha hydrolases-like protein [Pleomassaria siparia CBS 279.74]|uniref:tRNA(Ile)-lysidine synthetase n=1 Tax=Pleomassaria siparia CBS 279.74 TaxID=1314801 RepID=A0A6G1K1M8_9PLEO|nr:adenine nucleotide alpha hydrolases-like protein [Pleomassaria siparia CBS 279.74]